MAQYDGSVRINTKIRVKEAEVQLTTLENRMRKTADRITSLRSKMDALKDAKTPTKEYAKLQSQLDAAVKKFDELDEQVKDFQKMGTDKDFLPFKQARAEAQDLYMKIEDIRGAMYDLEESGKAFTLGSGSEEYAKLGQQLQYAESEMSVLNRKHDIQEMKLKKAGKEYRNLAGKAKSAFNSIGNVLKKTNATVDAFGRKIREVAQKHIPFFRKETEKAKSSASGFAGRLKSLALSLLIFNQISKAFRTLSSSISAGFTNMYNDDVRFKASIDSLRASVLTLQNAFAAAFRPIADVAIPYIQKLVDWLTVAVNLVGQFFAALAGRKTYTRAIRQTAKASEDAADATEEETEAMQKQLSPLDRLNNLTSENNKGKDKGKGDKETGAGIVFEEVPIDSKIQDMADKVKGILSKLFFPLKEAWNREGKFVMDSWKYAFDEVWKLIKDIGRDFLTVWQQEKTIGIFEDLLHILGDIGLAIGHLARNFRDAWNENETGLHILENIRDIIGAIVHNFRLAVDKTVEWADKLNFSPLLEAFERFSESLIPVADALSGILSDFYTQVLLPLGKWTLEKGLSELLDVFTAFNEKVDWDALRTRLSEFWDHLEPFAETVGEGLIIFIERVSNAIADFINSEAFDNFLTKIEEWMDSVTPEDVADALVGIAEALIALKGALLGFKAISAVSSIISSIFAALSLIPTALAVVTGAVIGWNIGDWINEKLLGVDTPSFFEMMEGIKSSITDGSWKEALHLWGEDIKAAWTEIFGTVGEGWDNLWGTVKNGWENLWKILETGWEGMLTIVKRGWDQAIESIKRAIEQIKSVMDSLKSSFDLFSGVAGGGLFRKTSNPGGGGASRMASPYAATLAIAALADLPIPGYATGQVIPRSMKQHLAILGDNPRETEVVSPLSTIEQAVINAMAKVGAVGTSGGSLTVEIPVILNGNEIGRAVQKFDSEFFKQNGRHAFA